MSNREIEDVLTSIRRLVAQEGTRASETGKLILTEAQRITPPAAVNAAWPAGASAGRADEAVESAERADEPAANAGNAAPSGGAAASDAGAAVPGAEGPSQAEEAPVTFGPRRPVVLAVDSAQSGPAPTPAAAPADAPGDAEEDDGAREGGPSAAAALDLNLPEPDFGKLEATIAELEAAVSASDEVWEPESGAAEDRPRPSNVTDLYGRLSFGRRAAPPPAPGPEARPDTLASPEVQGPPAPPGAQDAEPLAAAAPEVERVARIHPAPAAQTPPATEPMTDAAMGPQPQAEPAEAAAAPAEGAATFRHRPASPDGAEASAPPAEDGAFGADPVADGDEAEADAAEEIEEAILDEATLRVLVAQIVREELHGQLGERITQQVRKLVRAEIAKALDGHRYM